MQFLAYIPVVSTFNNLDNVKKFASIEPHRRRSTPIHRMSLETTFEIGALNCS